MPDLSTKYLGLTLSNPLVHGASPLANNLDNIRKMEDAGIGAIVLHSLFEEQINHDSQELDRFLFAGTDSFAEALNYFPEPQDFRSGPDEYVEHIHKAKSAVKVPIIASLNGVSTGGWLKYAKRIEEAGSDALELNIYYIPTDPTFSSAQVEENYITLVKDIKKNLRIPVAVKLSPFFSNMANIAKKLEVAGADALVMFNRFYQPDIDLDELEVVPKATLSKGDEQEFRLPLRWIAILFGKVSCDLALTTGVHSANEVIKGLMAGAKVTMLSSELITNGIGRIADIRKDMLSWMEEKEYESVQQMLGSMSQKSVPYPAVFERAHYMKALSKFQVD
ncbi:MAG: dihydroorotate dehydrogenase-like protein [SAR324 cluster bacterium]|uniref:Dihydroorotate dehydrogenase-like protein n=1 Tax=SAR324 cluster bacterium TaxID=2024889 RepID=A0A7X9FQ39_9DELT|nr:dihydroorotate dehydrogenase-like protein [SAR324 cluster bacterium]